MKRNWSKELPGPPMPEPPAETLQVPPEKVSEPFTLGLPRSWHAQLRGHCGSKTRVGGLRRPNAYTLPSREPTKIWPCDTLDRKSTRLNSSHANISYAV